MVIAAIASRSGTEAPAGAADPGSAVPATPDGGGAGRDAVSWTPSISLPGRGGISGGGGLAGRTAVPSGRGAGAAIEPGPGFAWAGSRAAAGSGGPGAAGTTSSGGVETAGAAFAGVDAAGGFPSDASVGALSRPKRTEGVHDQPEDPRGAQQDRSGDRPAPVPPRRAKLVNRHEGGDVLDAAIPFGFFQRIQDV